MTDPVGSSSRSDDVLNTLSDDDLLSVADRLEGGTALGSYSDWRVPTGRALRELHAARYEIEKARAQREAAIQKLTGIFALLDPPDVKVGEKTMRFVNPHAAEVLHELSERIRAIPEAMRNKPRSERGRDSDDADRWRTFCNLWAASTEMKVAQDEDGSWSIFQVEDVEGERFDKLIGADPDATIDLARSNERDER